MGNKRKSKKGIKNAKGTGEIDMDIDDVNMNELSDSDEEYTETEKNLLQKVRTKRTPENFDSDDEVYKLQDEEDMEDEGADSMESDIEGLQEDYDLPDERAWGKKKRAYYSTDYVDPDYATASQKDLEHAETEEQEARNIQQRLAEQLDDADFGLEFVQAVKEDNEIQEDKDQVIKTDLTKLSKRQRQELMQKESPEFEALVTDFKNCMTEARDILAPFLKLVENGSCPDCSAVSFVKTKYHLVLNYCVNISFYLMLKAKRLPVNSHPVIKRLAQYRQLLGQLQSGQGDLLEQVQEILKAEEKGKPLYYIQDGSKVTKKKEALSILKKKSKHEKKPEKVAEQFEEIQDDDFLEDKDDSNDEEIRENNEDLESEESEDEKEVAEEIQEDTAMYDANETEGKRAITYQIAKNKGLTPHRKKEQRNPRVKHRNKYRKAKIRRKGAVREVRKEISRYGGEISGIKAGVKKSIKIK